MSTSLLLFVIRARDSAIGPYAGVLAISAVTFLSWTVKQSFRPLAKATFANGPDSVLYVTRIVRAIFSDLVFLFVRPFTTSYFLSLLLERA